MNRKFFSHQDSCTKGCKYCFSKWDDYKLLKKFDIEYINNDLTILYPNCDGDFFDGNIENFFSLLMNSTGKFIISISVKSRITNEHLTRITDLNRKLFLDGRGFVKLSVSFSCKDMLDELEPMTLNYLERIEQAKVIVSEGLPYATIIKPVLPFIENSEYKALLDDTIKIAPYYVIGGLYVNQNTDFYNEYIEGHYNTSKREVAWYEKGVFWDYVDVNDKLNFIRQHIEDMNGYVFESDFDLLLSLKDDMTR